MKTQTKKRILFIGYNFSPELTGIGKYSGEMLEWLAEQGHECTVLTAYPYYPYWKVQEPYRKNRFWYKKEIKNFASGGKLRVLRCPMYVPEQPSGLKRMILDTSFSVTALLRMLPLLFQKKYDWSISVAPSFQFGLLGVLYKKLRGAKHLHHIQDLQIEAAQDLGLIKSPRLLKLLYGTERFIFRNTDVVSSISDGMMARIEKKAQKPLLFFPNWTETHSFYPMIENRGGLKEKFGFAPNDWVVLYSGAIGEKQGLEAILHTAQTLKGHKQLQFAICGTGPYKETLIHMAEEMGLPNMHFLPLQPKADFNAFLNMADLHLVIQKEKASDLVMPSKLTTILAVGGLALITANEQSSLHKIVRKYNMGLLVAAENQEALNTGILEAFQNQDNASIKKAARTYAENYLAIDTIMKTFEKKLYT
ncbi:WcaI family glycosyltransferase [Zobellia galactanivorans]|uniref:Glycosyltransferase, family GT4 n=1 Tax=Zobellia galactanivorans (strain DSM 12802 / CCUG 47099 / CIP 106680 / NCIMB 13871 / Dsij) TaxID=63186 RepID=G0L2T0_ZOBGA|nr:WcaI family glycosyltransferase [Zobellia galactanivorans]CAZ95172.1 Glycosyltransferase, family GT4 [Zobellia galactanivorans]